MSIDPRAIIEPSVQLGKDITIEAFAVIKGQVCLGDGVTVKSHAYIEGHVTIGEGSTIWPSACIGTQTQALKYAGEKTYVHIGKNCHIREFATINSSYDEGDIVSIGDDCLIMAYCHVAHHCKVGHRVIMSNAVNLAGHVLIEDDVTLGGMSALHQYTRVGRFAMVGGMSRVIHDVPPFTIGGGVPYKMGGINRVGLERKGFTPQQRQFLSRLFKLTYREKEQKLSDRLLLIRQSIESAGSDLFNGIDDTSSVIPLAKEWLNFCESSKRGLIDL